MNNWTEDETKLAFELYCIIPSSKVTIRNQEIIDLANKINRSVNSVKLKLQNFKSYDPSYTQNGRVGLSHGSKLDERIVNEFYQNWDLLIAETNKIKQDIGLEKTYEITNESEIIPMGRDKNVIKKQRIGQSFFRQALLAAYDYKCSFTGIAAPELLRASHIKSWSQSNDINEKTNPRNGILLNALHDDAFDKGYITITSDYEIIVSKELLVINEANKQYFIHLHGKKMNLPSRFLPDRHFIDYHNNSIFRG